jgi:hypothetical protein
VRALWIGNVANSFAAASCKSRQAAENSRQGQPNCGQRRKKWRQRHSKTRQAGSNWEQEQTKTRQEFRKARQPSSKWRQNFANFRPGVKNCGRCFGNPGSRSEKSGSGRKRLIGGKRIAAQLRGCAVARLVKLWNVSNFLMACEMHFSKVAGEGQVLFWILSK